MVMGQQWHSDGMAMGQDEMTLKRQWDGNGTAMGQCWGGNGMAVHGTTWSRTQAALTA